MSTPLPPAMLAICCSCLLAGCARWNQAPTNSAELPSPKMAVDSAVLEIRVVRIPQDTAEIEQSLWSQVDEQHFAFDLRRRLRDNGMRCGLLGSHLPDALREYIEQEDAEVENSTEALLQRNHEGTWREHLHASTGRRYRIVTTPTRDQINVISKEDGVVRGRTCRQAHCEFAVRTFPEANGTVRIELTPEVYYGEPRLDYEGKNQIGFIRVMKQNSLAFDQLRIDTTIAAGQTLLMSCTPDIQGLGRQFFADPAASHAIKIVLIRLAHTQADDLFAPGQTLRPIETLTD